MSNQYTTGLMIKIETEQDVDDQGQVCWQVKIVVFDAEIWSGVDYSYLECDVLESAENRISSALRQLLKLGGS